MLESSGEKSGSPSQKGLKMNLNPGPLEQVPSSVNVIDVPVEDSLKSGQELGRSTAPSSEQPSAKILEEEGPGSAAIGESSVPHDRTWSLYNAEAEKYDTVLSERLKGSSDSLLIYAGLFSATVTAFIIESYKTLNMDPQDTAVLYLAFISQQLVASTGQLNVTLPSITTPVFNAPTSSVCVNTLWVASLIFSLACALLATLVQSWLSRYARLVTKYPDPRRKAQERHWYFEGIKQSHLVTLVEALPALLHIAVSQFLAGLLIFLFPINLVVACVTSVVVVSFGVIYLVFTVFPLMSKKSPYRTPFTAPATVIVRVLFRWWLQVLACYIGVPWGSLDRLMSPYGLPFLFFPPPPSSPHPVPLITRGWRWITSIPEKFSRLIQHHAICCAHRFKRLSLNEPPSSIRRDTRSLRWLLHRTTSDTEFDKIIEGMLPMLLHDHTYATHQVLSPLMIVSEDPYSPFIWRFSHLLSSCSSNTDVCLGPAQRRSRVEMCTGILSQLFCRNSRFPAPYLTPTWIATDARFLLLSLYRLRVQVRDTDVTVSDPLIKLYAHLANSAIITSILAWQQHTGTIFEGVTIYSPQQWSFNDILNWLVFDGWNRHVDFSFVVFGLLQSPEFNPSYWSRPRPGTPAIGTHLLGQPSDSPVVLGPPELRDELVPLSPHMFANACYLTLLNHLLTHLLTEGPTSHPPAALTDMVAQSIASFYLVYNRSAPTDKDVQRTFIQLLEQTVGCYERNRSIPDATPGYPMMNRPDSSGTASSIFGDTVLEEVCRIVDVLDDPECCEKGREVVAKFMRMRPQVYAPSIGSYGPVVPLMSDGAFVGPVPIPGVQEYEKHIKYEE